MHELAIAESVVTMVLERTKGRVVSVVRLRVGQLAGVVPDALTFSFEVAAAGTALALAKARQSASEQASGAGLVRFSMLVTATVDDPAKLAQAAEVIDQLGPACQLRLRRCYFSQAAAFAAALGVGVVLPKHVTVPDVVRDHL